MADNDVIRNGAATGGDVVTNQWALGVEEEGGGSLADNDVIQIGAATSGDVTTDQWALEEGEEGGEGRSRGGVELRGGEGP